MSYYSSRIRDFLNKFEVRSRCSAILMAFLITQPAYCYFYTFAGLKSPVRAAVPPQKVFILGENHGLEQDANERQFENMIQALVERESFPSKLKVFLEYPWTNYIATSDVTKRFPMHGLMTHATRLDLKKTSIENCDLRKIDSGAYFLLSSDPFMISQRLRYFANYQDAAIDSLKNFGCNLATLTFQQLLENHDCWRRQCHLYRDFWKVPAIQDAFNMMLTHNECSYEYFIKELGSIDRTTLIHEYSASSCKHMDAQIVFLTRLLYGPFQIFLTCILCIGYFCFNRIVPMILLLFVLEVRMPAIFMSSKTHRLHRHM